MEANICYYCLHQLHMLPSQYFALPFEERVAIIGMVQLKVEQDQEREKELQRKQAQAKSKGRRRR